MIGVPDRSEAAEYYFKYIDPISSSDGDIVRLLENQMEEIPAVLRGISEEKSLYRYAPDKWSIRQVWNHVNDAERIFVSRALWFGRGFDSPLPSFEQEIAARAAEADAVLWTAHREEFRHIRAATLSFFRNLPAEAWTRRGTASGNPFTVRALAYIVAGHCAHHAGVLRQRYL